MRALEDQSTHPRSTSSTTWGTSTKIKAVSRCGNDLPPYERARGPEHTSTLDAINNLRDLYKNQGLLNDAEIMYDHALVGKEEA